MWEPEMVTDDQGVAALTVPLADSITTWRMNVDALSAAGALGAAEQGIEVFQDFFVDLDLPAAITQNDEVSMPVACHNYLGTPQTVTLEVSTGAGCAVDGKNEEVVRLGPNGVNSVRFRLRALDVGQHDIKVVAHGDRLSDAIRRQVTVKPDGTEVETLQRGTLATAADHTFIIPPEAIANTHDLLFKVYPTTFSEVVEGLENVFRKPFGCFEQTSSCTYANVMALLYMRRTGQSNAEVEAKAHKFINAGYQRLLAFEVPGGGFGWFDRGPADVALTAYGVLEFEDMAKAYDVDPAVVERAKQWLLSMQHHSGSWRPAHSHRARHHVSGELVTTAYVAWALVESGASDTGMDAALAYLRRSISETGQPYTRALAANALLTHNPRDPLGRSLAWDLASAFTLEGETAHLKSSGVGALFSRGSCLDVETTALAALALMKGNVRPGVVKRALTWISRSKGRDGTWGSTQATVLAMKALLAGAGASLRSETDSQVSVSVNGRPAGTLQITPDTSDLLHMLDLTEFLSPGENTIHLTRRRGMELPYQLAGTYWVPEHAIRVRPEKALEIDAEYDRTRLTVDDVLKCHVEVRNHSKYAIQMAIIDLGIPPGFTVDTAALAALEDAGRIARYEVNGSQCILYVRGLESRVPFRFEYELRARYPVCAKARPARVYEYYNPENEGKAPSQWVTVGAS
ncbi:MAG: alpha-2-macroglobulin family protein [Planctomycetota bacterium]